MTLMSRLEIAMSRKGMNKRQLATAMGVTPQTFSNLAKRPHATLRPENIAHAARALHCSLYWLCTGDGDVSTEDANGAQSYSQLVLEAAEALNSLSPDDQLKAYALVALIAKGKWPRFVGLDSADNT